VYPDVTVSERMTPSGARGGVAMVADPYTRLTVAPVEIREVFVEVFSLEHGERVVTTMEILSPSNKRAGSTGRDLYLAKQEALIASKVNMIEIDLLRTGAHTLAAPLWKVETMGQHDYLILLHRVAKRWDYQVRDNRMRDRLPRIEVPLLSGDPDVVLDLQECMDQTYDNGPYLRRINYARDPNPPLADDDAKWADALLREKGLR
jgi:hypothetical protein